MIFVCVGSREYQFNRLLSKLDELIAEGKRKDTIFAQIGKSDYLPKNYNYERFIPADKFKEYQYNADLIISHGGTGALIGALKMGKHIIAVPRLAKFGEHIDDHQIQVSKVLAEEGYLRCVIDIDELYGAIKLSKISPISKKYNKPSNVISLIEHFISSDLNRKKNETRIFV